MTGLCEGALTLPTLPRNELKTDAGEQPALRVAR